VCGEIPFKRRPKSIQPSRPNVEPSRLDITNQAEIALLVKRIANDPDRPLRALVNNAGIQFNA
jgi:NAD(P)-dependent dehydrogenase (short-subunit alcohol dehydrogenase family)